MTLRIQKFSDRHRSTIRLIGRMRAEHLASLQALLSEGDPSVALDLEEVLLVDVETVRFLGACQSQGVALLNCSAYINDWIAKEQAATSKEERRKK